MNDRRSFLGRILALPFALKATQEGAGVKPLRAATARLQYAQLRPAVSLLSGETFIEAHALGGGFSSIPLPPDWPDFEYGEFNADPLRPCVIEETKCPFTHTFVIDVSPCGTIISRCETTP